MEDPTRRRRNASITGPLSLDRNLPNRPRICQTGAVALFRAKSKTPTTRVEAADTAAVSSATLALLSASVGAGRERAMRIPTISRARDLLAGLISTTPLRYYRREWDGEKMIEVPIQPEAWMMRPDRRTTFAHIMSWTFDDLFHFGRAYWHIDARFSTGFPSSCSWLPAELVNLQSPVVEGNYPIGGITEITVSGQRIPIEDVIVFYSPVESVLSAGARAITTSERLELAAQRFSTNPVAMGYLRQTGGEPMTADELSELAGAWIEMRSGDNGTAIAALNEFTEFVESSMDPSRLQLVEARQHQALELARVANISPYLVGAPTGSSMTYQNATEARRQLAQDALPFLSAIEETLSGDMVTPRGHVVRFDRSIFQETAGTDTTGEGDQSDSTEAREIAELIQKIYLGVVNDVITRDEARDIINRAGGNL